MITGFPSLIYRYIMFSWYLLRPTFGHPDTVRHTAISQKKKEGKKNSAYVLGCNNHDDALLSYNYNLLLTSTVALKFSFFFGWGLNGHLLIAAPKRIATVSCKDIVSYVVGSNWLVEVRDLSYQ